MNALVAARSNATGLMSPTPAERQAAAAEMWSTARARVVGRLKAQLRTLRDTAAAQGDAKTAERAEVQLRTLGGASESSSTDTDLGRDAFLQLLVQQMQYQDPMDPMNNEDMIANLAQFSSLEQMENLNTSFESLSTVLTEQSVVTASGLLGKTVAGLDIDGLAAEGVVDRVYVSGGVAYLQVGEQTMALGSVLTVE